MNPDVLNSIGSPIYDPTNMQRDAIHVAILPVIVKDEKLEPGTHVNIEDGNYVTRLTKGRGIGIIDPFLKHSVYKGSMCWLFLYPYTVNSIRHHWTHPFVDKNTDSETWLRHFVDTYFISSYEDLIEAALYFEVNDELTIHTKNSSYNPLLECSSKEADLFWSHLENVTGLKFNTRKVFHSCSC